MLIYKKRQRCSALRMLESQKVQEIKSALNILCQKQSQEKFKNSQVIFYLRMNWKKRENQSLPLPKKDWYISLTYFLSLIRKHTEARVVLGKNVYVWLQFKQSKYLCKQETHPLCPHPC